MPDPMPADVTGAERVADVLAASYRLTDVDLVRLPVGQGTTNYRVTSRGRTLFVKHYPTRADLAAEAGAIALTQLAGQHGVPVPAVLPTAHGEVIGHHRDVGVSVWEWAPGHTVENGFTAMQQTAAGTALGRIHRLFATHPASSGTPTDLHGWLHPDLTGLAATIDTLLGVIRDRATPDTYDVVAAHTLTERRAALRHVPGLLADLPALTCQVLHGDYSAVNLLFDGDRLTAVLDFRPPSSFLVAFEVGRIAFDPRTVVLSEDWISRGAILVAGYLRENPLAAVADVRSSARVALIQLLTSLYGVRNHYLNPDLLQDDLDAFWLLRHRAAAMLLEHLDEAETALDRTLMQAGHPTRH
ncbi:MAG: phosphotransferase [Actinobacteria bacterium]|nr:phosphotransferase [Actinomycetota bacterium]MBI3687670.1 phosphotransferase [Actinomycetota bacterium]